MSANIIQIIDAIYIVSVVLFILAIKWLSSPATARHGVIAGEIGAALAVTATLFNPALVQYKWIAVALIVGAAIGILAAEELTLPREIRSALDDIAEVAGRQATVDDHRETGRSGFRCSLRKL